MNTLGNCKHEFKLGQTMDNCQRGATETCCFCGLSHCVPHMKEECPDSPGTTWGQTSHAIEKSWQMVRDGPEPGAPRTVRSVSKMPGKRTIILETTILEAHGETLPLPLHLRQYAGTITKKGKAWEMDGEMREWLSRYIGDSAKTLGLRWPTEREVLEDIRGLMEWEWRRVIAPARREPSGAARREG